MPPLLSAGDWPAVRAALDVTFDAAMLPDAIIALDQFAGAGERTVRALVPGVDTLAGDDVQRAHNAAIFFTAAAIAPSVPSILRQELLDIRLFVAQRDWLAYADFLAGRAQAELAALTQLTPPHARPVLFRAGVGTRGNLARKGRFL